MTTATIAPPAAPAVRLAVRDVLPIALTVAPFGTVVGVALQDAGLVGVPAVLATLAVNAGSAQLAAVTVVLGGGSAVVAVLTGALVNVRLLLYSAGLATRFRSHPRWFRWAASQTIIDQMVVLVGQHPHLTGAAFRRYWLAASGVLVGVWNVAVVAGTLLGSAVPDAGPFEVALPAAMVSLLVPQLGRARVRRAVAVSAVVAVAARGLPPGVGVVVAILAAMALAGPEERR